MRARSSQAPGVAAVHGGLTNSGVLTSLPPEKLRSFSDPCHLPEAGSQPVQEISEAYTQ